MTEYFPVIDNVTIQQGVTYARAYPVSGIVMAGATATAQVRQTPQSSIVLVQFGVTFEIDPDDPQAAVITLTVDPAASAVMNWSQGFWDGILTAVDGTVSQFAKGLATFSPGVTR